METSFVCLAAVAIAATLSFGANAQEHHGPAGQHPNGYDSNGFDAGKYAQMKADHMRKAFNLDQKILTPEQYKAYKHAQHRQHRMHGNRDGANVHQHPDGRGCEGRRNQPPQPADQNAAL